MRQVKREREWSRKEGLGPSVCDGTFIGVGGSGGAPVSNCASIEIKWRGVPHVFDEGY